MHKPLRVVLLLVALLLAGCAADPSRVASAKSEVFHRTSCGDVSHIKPENRVLYANRDEALQAGKRPCNVCNP